MTTLNKRKIPKQRPVEKREGYYGNKPIKEATGNGGLITTEEHMGLAAPTPCNECPLRRDCPPGHLGGYSPEMYLEAMASPASLACHRSKGFHERKIGEQRHCTGVAAFRANTGTIASIVVPTHVGVMVVPSLAHESTKAIGSDTETYFATAQEFYDHHKPGQK